MECLYLFNVSQMWREYAQYVKGSLFTLPSSCFLTRSTGMKENQVIMLS